MNALHARLPTILLGHICQEHQCRKVMTHTPNQQPQRRSLTMQRSYVPSLFLQQAFLMSQLNNILSTPASPHRLRFHYLKAPEQ